jgi:heme-degrading monooxygenase HmoA
MKRNVSLLITLALAGCGDDSAPAIDAGSSSDAGSELCRAGVLEPDAAFIPFAGRGVDSETDELLPFAGPVVVSSTYIRIKPEGAERFQELSGAVVGEAVMNPGLLAVGLEISGMCGTARTLTIWESTEAMYRFVTTPAHTTAMAEANAVALMGSTVVHWTASSPEEAGWEAAVQRVGSAPPIPLYE